jgi:hypothetical protein
MFEMNPRDTESGIQWHFHTWFNWRFWQILRGDRTKIKVLSNDTNPSTDIFNELKRVKLAVTCVHEIHMFLQMPSYSHAV